MKNIFRIISIPLLVFSSFPVGYLSNAQETQEVTSIYCTFQGQIFSDNKPDQDVSVVPLSDNQPMYGVAVKLTSDFAGLTIAPQEAITDTVGGSAKFSVKSTKPGNAVIHVQSGSVSKDCLTIVIGQKVDSTKSSLEASVYSAPADGSTPVVLTMTARDASGNPIPNRSITFKPSWSGGSNGDINLPTNSVLITDHDGKAKLNVIASKPGVLGGNFVDAVDQQGASLLPGVEFKTAVVPVLSTTLSTVTKIAPAGSVLADGQAAAVIKVQVKDTDGQPMPGKTVSLLSLSGPLTFSDAQTTDADGYASLAVRSTTAKNYTVTARVGDVSLAATVDIVFIGQTATNASSPANGSVSTTDNQQPAQNANTPTHATPTSQATAPPPQTTSKQTVSEQRSSLMVLPTELTVGETMAFILTLKDVAGAPIANRYVELMVSINGEMKVRPVTTDAAGVARLDVEATEPGEISASAMVDSALFIASATAVKGTDASAKTASSEEASAKTVLATESNAPTSTNGEKVGVGLGVGEKIEILETKAIPEPQSKSGKFVWNKASGILTYQNPASRKILKIWDARWGFGALRSQATVVSSATLKKIPQAAEKKANNMALRKRYAGQILVSSKTDKFVWYINPNDLKRYWFDGSAKSYAYLILVADKAGTP